MNSKWTPALILALAITLVGVGCSGNKDVETPADMSSSDSSSGSGGTTPDVSRSPDISTDDRTTTPLDAEIVEADTHARQTGLIGDVYFDFDKYELKAEARDRLTKNAAFLRERPEFVITIEGHCDERGTNDYNIALGDRRANAARDFLIDAGIAGNRVNTISYGEERPTCTQSDESCWSKNRRAEFHITSRR